MTKTTRILCLPLVIGLFGSFGSGCLPSGETSLARYDVTRYTPSTDGNGFAGTWIITNNNDSTAPIAPFNTFHARDLVRIKPVTDVPDNYEITYCSYYDQVINRTTVVATADSIPLPVSAEYFGVATYATTGAGRMTAAITDGDLTMTWRAVRVSGNPEFDAGTVRVSFSGDTAVTSPSPLPASPNCRSRKTSAPATS